MTWLLVGLTLAAAASDVARLDECRQACAVRASRAADTGGRQIEFDACSQRCWYDSSLSRAPPDAQLAFDKVAAEVAVAVATFDLQAGPRWGDATAPGCLFWGDADACKRDCLAGHVRSCAHFARRSTSAAEKRTVLEEACWKGDARSCALAAAVASPGEAARTLALVGIGLGLKGCAAGRGYDCLGGAESARALGSANGWAYDMGNRGCSAGEAEACVEYVQASPQIHPDEYRRVLGLFLSATQRGCSARDDWQCWLQARAHAGEQMSTGRSLGELERAAIELRTLCDKGCSEACAKSETNQRAIIAERDLSARQQAEQEAQRQREEAQRRDDERRYAEALERQRQQDEDDDRARRQELERQNQERLEELDRQQAESARRDRETQQQNDWARVQREANDNARRLQQQQQQQFDQTQRALREVEQRQQRERDAAQQRAEKTRREADERAQRDADERSRREARDRATQEAVDQRRRDAEERSRKEEQAREKKREEEERARAEARARVEAAEQARKEKAEEAKRIAEEKRAEAARMDREAREAAHKKAQELADAANAELRRKANTLQQKGFELTSGESITLGGIHLVWTLGPASSETCGLGDQATRQYSSARLTNQNGVRWRATLSSTWIHLDGVTFAGAVSGAPQGLYYLDPGESKEIGFTNTCFKGRLVKYTGTLVVKEQ